MSDEAVNAPQVIAHDKYRINGLGHPELYVEEVLWFELGRVIGILTKDKWDHDYGYVLFERHGEKTISAVDVQTSLATVDLAREELIERIKMLHDVHEKAHLPGLIEKP